MRSSSKLAPDRSSPVELHVYQTRLWQTQHIPAEGEKAPVPVYAPLITTTIIVHHGADIFSVQAEVRYK